MSGCIYVLGTSPATSKFSRLLACMPVHCVHGNQRHQKQDHALHLFCPQIHAKAEIAILQSIIIFMRDIASHNSVWIELGHSARLSSCGSGIL